MIEKHNREGLLICNMTDQHLQNMISLVCTQIAAIRKNIRDHQAQTPEQQYHKAMYGGPTFDVEEAVYKNQEKIRFLYPYLAEAFLRGMEDLREILVEAMGRDSAVFADPDLAFGNAVIDVEGNRMYLIPKEAHRR